MAALAESAVRAVGTHNFDFRLPAGARGVIILVRITAKGAGAATLALDLQVKSEADGSFAPLTDFVTAAPTPVGIAATAVSPTEFFELKCYPSHGVVVPAAGKKRAFSGPVPGGLRLVATVAVDTITMAISAKPLY